MRVTPITPTYKPQKWFVGLRHNDSYLVNVETKERRTFDSVRETWEAKEKLEKGIIV